MAYLGAIATKLTLRNLAHQVVRLTQRNSSSFGVAYFSPGWAGHTAHPQPIAPKMMHITRSTPAWWGTQPAGSSPILPTFELRGQVLQEDVPLPNVRVGLFFRKTHYLVDIKITDEDGYFVFPNIMPGNQAYYAIAYDPEGDPLQNSLIYDRLTSQEP